MRRRSFRSFLGTGHANAAIEFALIVPIMVSIFAGIVEFGRAFQVYGAVNRLASRYAAAWADCSDAPAGVCNTELSTYTAAAAIKNLAPQLTGAVTLRMIEVTMTGSGATVVYAFPSGATLTASEYASAQTVIPSGETGVVVTVAYTHALMFFQQIMTPFLGASRNVTYSVAQLKS